MTTLTTLIPIVVAVVLSFCFKNTRWIGIVSIAVTSYFYPLTFLLVGSVAGLVFWYWKFRRVRA